MKSYILYGVSNATDASTELDRYLDRSGDGTWTLLHEGGDAIAYFSVGPGNKESELSDEPPKRGSNVQADISGRHFYDDAIVLSVLRKVQDVVGGVIRDDDDATV
ncbi:hypothetical protein [Methylosinus sp. sav-2]|jgi:hypothetical protein|uniref:hypothetical protein n=1 Tax=Methylosinus sp. sav-2 TaxID=2485168 RepID=UPI00047D4523|nr:hypothetical protein [Methylosinus sp. sav-2]